MDKLTFILKLREHSGLPNIMRKETKYFTDSSRKYGIDFTVTISLKTENIENILNISSSEEKNVKENDNVMLC